jgi:hypothetical protein
MDQMIDAAEPAHHDPTLADEPIIVSSKGEKPKFAPSEGK